MNHSLRVQTAKSRKGCFVSRQGIEEPINYVLNFVLLNLTNPALSPKWQGGAEEVYNKN